MKRMLGMALAVALAGSTATATDLNVAVQAADGSSAMSVGGGATVNYRVVGQLGDTENMGLALSGFDLELVDEGGQNAGALPPADVPSSGPMANFVKPAGITNPDDNCPPQCGYAGTQISNKLVQCGGGGNTINNDIGNAPFPIGGVVLNIAHSQEVLLTGSLTAPTAEGVYTLRLTSLFANVIVSEEASYWATEAANVGTIDNLTITVGGDVNLLPGECGMSLTRAHDNCFDLTFDGAITAPGAGEILIHRLQESGAYDPTDLSAQFNITADGAVLTIAEIGDVLSNGEWYAIRNTGGWGGANPFKVDIRVVYGDVNNNGSTTAADASDVWGNRGVVSGPCDPYDIDGNGSITAADASDAWGFRGSSAGDKPSEHVCSP